ncbi:glycosyltransferase [Thermodesulfobacteriota bacterium]
MDSKQQKHELDKQLDSAIWLPAAGIPRRFVRHSNPEISSPVYWKYSFSDSATDLSVIIPTLDANRGGYFPKLLGQIEHQDFAGFEVIVVRGDPRQGRAINIGAAIAKGKYLMTLDDDTSLPDPKTFRKLFAVMASYTEIGIAGGNNVIPEEASSFVRRVMEQVPRRSWQPVQVITDSDLAEHPCMIMRADEFKAVGGENELIPRGLDPYLREQFRKIDKRVVVVPGVIYHHLPPNDLVKLLRQFFRNGRQAAYTNRNYPQWIIETPSTHGSFKVHVQMTIRLFRFPIRLLRALITGKTIWFLSEIAYALGFIFDMVTQGQIGVKSTIDPC